MAMFFHPAMISGGCLGPAGLVAVMGGSALAMRISLSPLAAIGSLPEHVSQLAAQIGGVFWMVRETMILFKAIIFSVIVVVCYDWLVSFVGYHV